MFYFLKADPLDCALDLMRRLPPDRIEDNLASKMSIKKIWNK